MPAAVVYFAPQDHVRVFAVLAALVAFVSMAVPPVAGALSDRLRREGVPRRAFILAGAAVDVVCLVMMAEVRSLGLFALFLLLATAGANVALAAYQALLPDVVPKQFWGTVSGVRGVAMVIGVVVGIGVAAGTYPQSTFIGIAVAVALGAITLFAVSEHDAGNAEEDHAHISDWHDFVVVFIARLFLAFGLSLLMTFILYFFRDVLKVGDPKVGTGLVAAAALIGSIASAVYLGWLSDRVPRKLVVAACGIPMTLAAAGFAIVPEERWMYAFSVLFGIGFGGVLSTGWALAIDSVPKLRDVARDLGTWGIAQNFPAVIAPLFGGWLLATYGTSIAGYRLLFFAAAGSFAIGSLSVLAVGRRPLLPWWGMLLRLIIGSVVWIFTHAANRIRMWGRLPRRRGPALVISNHQNELDLMPFTALGFLTATFRSPFLAATAKLLFEPGFMAVRFPSLWRVLRNLNMNGFFRSIGLLPIENELQSRSIARWAWSVERSHGVLPLEEIFKAPVIERYGLQGLTTRDLFRAQYFQTAQDAYVRITELQAVYGKEQLDVSRRGVEEDMAAFEDAVRRGATMYVTPEGGYTVTGAALPFRGIWERLEPLAGEIYIAAISYDPFAPKFSQLYHVVPLQRREQAENELRAARAVTVSALLSSWLIERDAAFTEDEAVDAVRTSLSALPRGVFVDPELEQSPDAVTRRALASMLRLKILERTETGYMLAAERKHPNYPMVEDIVAFQARFIGETLDAAVALSASERQ
ncbi:MAG TPA: MFS transporter [Candidatus Rubrimentiphilum sp.]|nr:MFS transporter [Candidatus Rubrimentiphilum sp.]